MKKLFLIAFAVSLSSLACCSQEQAAPAAAVASGKTAQEIVDMVHMSRALQDNILQGKLTKGGRSAPFTVKLKDSLIHFSFENPKQNINLDITDKGYRLK